MVKEFDRDEYISECYAQGMDKCVVKKQEPVAWMQMFEDGEDRRMSLDFERIGINDIPLYTAPRELSDDDIWDVWSLLGERESRVIDFARAILKKASEK